MNGESTTATIKAVICSRTNSAHSSEYWMAASSVRDLFAKIYISVQEVIPFCSFTKKSSFKWVVCERHSTNSPSLPRPFPAFPSICPVFTHLSRRHSSFAARASSHSTLPLGKSVQVNISRSLMLKGSDSGRYATGRELPVPRATATAVATHQNRGHCLCLRCFYPIKQQTCVIGTQRRVTHSLGSSSFPERTRGGGGCGGVGGWWGGGQSGDCNVNALCWNENEPSWSAGSPHFMWAIILVCLRAERASHPASEWARRVPLKRKLATGANGRKTFTAGEGGGESTAAFDRAPRWSTGDGFWAGEASAGLVTGSDLGVGSTLHLGARCRPLWCGRPRCIRCPPAFQGVFRHRLQRLISFPLWSSVQFLPLLPAFSFSSRIMV